MELLESFISDMAAGPQWVRYWVDFMLVVFLLAVPFAFIRVEARWALVVLALSGPAMFMLYKAVGYVRLLGIVHVVIWTPFAIYLWRRRDRWRVRETVAGKWIALLFAVMMVSLAFDIVDVARYAIGDANAAQNQEPRQPMSEKHHTINYVEFTAQDLAPVKAFYTAAFSWTWQEWGPDYVSFSGAGLDGGFERQDKAPETGGALVVLYSDDLEASEKKVIAAGGEIVAPIFSFPGGRRFHFRDPAGNELAVWTEVAVDQ